MTFFSPHWYRVENLKPRLRAHARIQRHHYRGERWYVIEDAPSGRYHRFRPDIYYLIAMMDGERTVSEIWNAALSRFGDDAPAQNELILLLSQLHASDLLQSDVLPDTAEVFQRFSKASRARWVALLMNPMFARIPLWDPDAWLLRWAPVAARLFRPWVLVLWCLVVGFAALQTGRHWAELSAPSLSAIIDPMNLAMLVFTYPLVKLLHELGHAFTTRIFGGEVHEVGVMFLILVPMPYVDASASSAFGNKWHRILVAASGVMIELFISALALFVWLELAPGLLRSLLWNVMLIGGASTLFFNGNPLLRFDGYYVLCDLIEIPNLAARSKNYLTYLFEHYVLRLPERRFMAVAPGERAWFVTYGLASWLYRMTITFGIALYLAGRFFVIGVLLALWGLLLQIVLPLVQGILKLRDDPRVQQAQTRVVATLAVLACSLLLGGGVVPLPAWSTFDGVVWIPERAQIRAGAAGFVRRLVAHPGTLVEPGQLLIETADPLVESELRVLEARLEEARAERTRERNRSVAKGRIADDEVARIAQEVEVARTRRARADIVSQDAGRFVLIQQHIEGLYVDRGDVLGYVANLSDPIVRLVVAEDDIDAVRRHTRSISVRLAEAPERLLPVRLDHIVPTATDRLPSMALGAGGGGSVAVDARDPDGLTTVEPYFQVDVALPKGAPITGIGGRVHVRFDFEPEPLFTRGARGLRRLFMGELGV